MEKFGLKVYEDLIIQGNFTEESGYKAMKEFISRKKEKCLLHFSPLTMKWQLER